MSLPSTYIQLEYLESTGTQYIDTGITNSTGNQFEVGLSNYVQPSTFDYPFGARTVDSVNGIYLICYYGNMLLGTNGETGLGAHSTGNYDISIKDNKIVVNDIEYPYSPTTATTTNILIFSCYYDSIPYNASVRIKYFRIYDSSSVLLRDFVPAARLSDSSLGLYDLINDVFYTNQGTGTFIAGPAVQENIILTDNPLSVILGSNLSIQANFRLLGEPVTATINPEGSGSVTGTGYYQEGVTVSLLANNNYNTSFNNWTVEGQTITTNPYVFTMGSSAVNVIANFTELADLRHCLLKRYLE